MDLEDEYFLHKMAMWQQKHNIAEYNLIWWVWRVPCASQDVWGVFTIYVEKAGSLSPLSPSGPLCFSANEINRPRDQGGREALPLWHLIEKNIISVENHLFHERYLLVIKGLKRLSKVSEITLVTKLGTRQLTFSAKLQQRIRRDAFFTKWRSNRLLALLVSKF